MARKPWRNSSKKPWPREGYAIPMTLWKCTDCGRRFRGDIRWEGHSDRSGHCFAVGHSMPKWKTAHL